MLCSMCWDFPFTAVWRSCCTLIIDHTHTHTHTHTLTRTLTHSHTHTPLPAGVMFNSKPCIAQRLIPPYLIVGGVFLTVMVWLKVAGCLLTCCRNRNWLHMTKGGDRSALGICAIEVFCLCALLVNVLLLALGAYYIMKDIKSDIRELCLNQHNWMYLYYASAVAVLLQPALCLCSSILVCCGYACSSCEDNC